MAHRPENGKKERKSKLLEPFFPYEFFDTHLCTICTWQRRYPDAKLFSVDVDIDHRSNCLRYFAANFYTKLRGVILNHMTTLDPNSTV